ncbi:hypothetical protein [Streptomyces sp. NBC_01518]|uniref:aromatic-ring hydroxylase C-terminal domain-containing protein n=1 Tax=Streptomyces sp. NBC_01518 TaxID=2903891 RepID=UPI0038654CF4
MDADVIVVGAGPIPAPRFLFGGVHLDLTRLDDPPLHALPIPRQRLEEVPAGRAGELGEVFQEPLADEQPQRRLGALVAGTDIRYPMPGPSGQHPPAGAFVPDLTLHGDGGVTGVGRLLHTARPLLLNLADREDLRRAAAGWRSRVDVRTAKTDDRPADAILIRPDAHIAWAEDVDESPEDPVPALREALTRWFGEPESDV